jgi:hypothetical protein
MSVAVGHNRGSLGNRKPQNKEWQTIQWPKEKSQTNPDPGLGHTQQGGGVEPVNVFLLEIVVTYLIITN